MTSVSKSSSSALTITHTMTTKRMKPPARTRRTKVMMSATTTTKNEKYHHHHHHRHEYWDEKQSMKIIEELRKSVQSCNDITEEDLNKNSGKFVNLLISSSSSPSKEQEQYEHVGFVRPDFAKALLAHGSEENGYALFSTNDDTIIIFDKENRYTSMDDKTNAVGKIFEKMRKLSLVPGWRNEMFPVVSNRGNVCLNVERATASLLGIRAFGVHVNGFVAKKRKDDEGILLWVGRRSKDKQTFPGLLDHLSAGGLPAGMSPTICAIKELAEEAGVPEEYSEKYVKSVSCVSYQMFYKDCVKRDVLFCYDLELDASFVPKPVDGEVESFELMPIEKVIEIIAFEPGRFKPNCTLVIIDFAIRKGVVTCDMPGYLELVKSLRR
jgi:8-oxo-dGTP pyrophosphatase MutT (NUDIX family)